MEGAAEFDLADLDGEGEVAEDGTTDNNGQADKFHSDHCSDLCVSVSMLFIHTFVVFFVLSISSALHTLFWNIWPHNTDAEIAWFLSLVFILTVATALMDTLIQENCAPIQVFLRVDDGHEFVTKMATETGAFTTRVHWTQAQRDNRDRRRRYIANPQMGAPPLGFQGKAYNPVADPRLYFQGKDAYGKDRALLRMAGQTYVNSAVVSTQQQQHSPSKQLVHAGHGQPEEPPPKPPSTQHLVFAFRKGELLLHGTVAFLISFLIIGAINAALDKYFPDDPGDRAKWYTLFAVLAILLYVVIQASCSAIRGRRRNGCCCGSRRKVDPADNDTANVASIYATVQNPTPRNQLHAQSDTDSDDGRYSDDGDDRGRRIRDADTSSTDDGEQSASDYSPEGQEGSPERRRHTRRHSTGKGGGRSASRHDSPPHSTARELDTGAKSARKSSKKSSSSSSKGSHKRGKSSSKSKGSSHRRSSSSHHRREHHHHQTPIDSVSSGTGSLTSTTGNGKLYPDSPEEPGSGRGTKASHRQSTSR